MSQREKKIIAQFLRANENMERNYVTTANPI